MKTTLASINIAAWIALALIVAIFGFLVAWHPSPFAQHSTRGSITELLPDHDQSVEYVYLADGAAYRGIGTAGDAGRNFESLRIGDRVTVCYDPRNPSASTLASVPTVHAIASLIAACAAIPLVIMLLLHHQQVLPQWALFGRFSSRSGTVQTPAADA